MGVFRKSVLELSPQSTPILRVGKHLTQLGVPGTQPLSGYMINILGKKASLLKTKPRLPMVELDTPMSGLAPLNILLLQ